jgi:hypothetical protein
VRTAQKLLGAQTIGQGECRAGDGGGGSQRVKYAPKLPRMYKNGGKNEWFSALIDFKIAGNAIFT